MENAAPSAPPPTPQTAAPSNGTNVPNDPQQSQGGQPVTENNGASPAKAKEPEKPQTIEEELIELAINGRNRKVNRQELINYAQMGASATARYEEAKQMKKDMDAIREMAPKDGIAVLQQLGLNKEQIVQQLEAWYTKEVIDPAGLSPEERKMKEYELKLKQYEEQEQEKLRSQQEQELSQLTAKQRDYLSNQIIQVLEKGELKVKDAEGKFYPRAKQLTARVAFYMQQNMENGWEAPLDVIVQQVKDENQSLLREQLEGLPGEELVKTLPESVINEIQAYLIRQMRARKQNSITAAPQYPNGEALPNGQQKIYSSDVRKRLREMTTGRKQIT